MHAAPALLSDLEDAIRELDQWVSVCPDGGEDSQAVIDSTRESVAEATGLKLKQAA